MDKKDNNGDQLTIPFWPTLFGAGLLAICIPLLSLVMADQHSQDVLMSRALGHFKQQYFSKNIKAMEFSNMIELPGDELAEERFRLSLTIQNSSKEMVVLNDCYLDNRPHCGWMGLSCRPNLYGSDLKQLTRQGDSVLIFTYDQVRSTLCRQK